MHTVNWRMVLTQRQGWFDRPSHAIHGESGANGGHQHRPQ
jgi:hypothetical protein